MSAASNATDRILNALRPYASNWSGTLGRGDLVIPQADVPKLVQEILHSVDDVLGLSGEVSDFEIFQALSDEQRMASLQDRVADLRRRFRISKR
jgi:hypothetical protein